MSCFSSILGSDFNSLFGLSPVHICLLGVDVPVGCPFVDIRLVTSLK